MAEKKLNAANEIEMASMLARSAAVSLYGKFGNPARTEEMTAIFAEAFRELLRTHCVARKEQIMELYALSRKFYLEECGNPTIQAPYWAEIHQLQTLFGKEMFETDTDTNTNDDH